MSHLERDRLTVTGYPQAPKFGFPPAKVCKMCMLPTKPGSKLLGPCDMQKKNDLSGISVKIHDIKSAYLFYMKLNITLKP